MSLYFIIEDVSISRKRFASVVILVSASFAWLFMLFTFFEESFITHITDVNAIDIGYFLFLGVAVFSAIVGSIISEKLDRRKFLISWILYGLVVNASLLFIPELDPTSFYLLSSLFGISIGLGFPSCLAFLADCTATQERARVSGIIIMTTIVLAILSFMIASAIGFGSGLFILLCTVKGTSLFAFVFDDFPKRKPDKPRSWVEILQSKDFGLYLFPWLMFSFIGSLTDLIYLGASGISFSSISPFGMILHYLTWAIFGVISGIIADYIGRREPIIVGLVLLGVSFAILAMAVNEQTVFAYYTLSGVAWGFLFTVYISVLGDLSSVFGSKERFYSIGAIMPLILTLGFSTITDLFDVTVPAAILSPILTIILFVSIYPVMRASETLPFGLRAKTRGRKLQEHIKKIKEIVEESESE